MQYNDCAQQKVKKKITFVENEAGKLLQSQKVNMRWGWMSGAAKHWNQIPYGYWPVLPFMNIIIH